MNNIIFYFFYNLAHQSVFFDKVIVFFAESFPYIVIILAGLFLFRRSNQISDPQVSKFFGRWKEIIFIFFAGGLAVFLDLILKYIIHAPRPFLALTDVYALFPETGYAFPSGHATFFSALAVSLFFLDKKVGYVFMFFAFLIGLARIIAGVHFPIDILSGFVLGALIAIFVNKILTNK